MRMSELWTIVTEDVTIEHDDGAEVPHAMIASFDDVAYIRFWKTAKNVLVIQSFRSSDAIRGRDMLRWLKDTYRMPIIVVEVTWEAAGFWDKMQAEGLIDRWDEIPETGEASPLSKKSVPL